LESHYHPESRALGDSAHHVSCKSHIETWYWGWFIKLDHPSIFHGSFDGQRKLLKGAEEIQVVPEIVWARFVPPVLWLSSASRAQMAAEEELGQCCPTVFQEQVHTTDILSMYSVQTEYVLSTYWYVLTLLLSMY
jgi:hypothetical protein